MTDHESETPSVISYALIFYDLLEKNAKLNEYEELIFRGSLTKLYKKVGGSTAYYSRIRRLLIESGAVEIIARGTGKQKSEVKLNGRPEDLSAIPLTSSAARAKMPLEVERRLTALEAWRDTTGGLNIAEVLRDFEKRISRLESKREA